jgi:hypothetical protein
VRVCVHRGECSYIYEYLHLYCVSQKNHNEAAATRKIEEEFKLEFLEIFSNMSESRGQDSF